MLNKIAKKTLILIILLIILVAFLLFFTFYAAFTRTKNLSEEEKGYKEAAEQVFKKEQGLARGTLIVSSTPTGARVLVDAPDEEVSNNKDIPVNVTPFKFSSIPEGVHKVSVFAEGYIQKTEEVKVQAGKVIRMNIDLISLTPKDGPEWRSKLPFESDYYFVDYDDKRGVIVANLKSINGVAPEGEQLELLRKEVLHKLELRDVPLDKENIEWIIK